MIVDLIVAASALWQWWNNPFLVRSFRRDWRGRDILRSLYAYTLFLGLVFALVLTAAWCIGPRGFHEDWGGSWGGLAATLASAAHVVLVWRASGAGRRREWIAVERQTGALEMVLVSPLTRAEIVLYKATYPWALSAAVGLMGLPLYVLSWALGGFSLLQILALYVVMGALCLRPTIRLAPGALAGSRKLQTVLICVSLAAGFVWGGAAGGGGSAGAAFVLSLPITFGNVATHWLVSPAPLFGIRIAPLPLVLMVLAMHWGMEMLLAAAELDGWNRRYLQAVAKLRYCLGVFAVLLALGWSWPSLMASGALAGRVGCPGASALQAAALVVAGLVLLLCGLELLEKGGTLSSPLTAFGLWSRSSGPAWLRVGRGAAHAVSCAVAVPALTALAAALGGGPWGPGDAELMANATLACACGLLWCYAVGMVLRVTLRARPQAWGGACLVAAIVAVAAVLAADPVRGMAGPVTWVSPAIPLVLLAPGTSAGVSTALSACAAQAGAALALLVVVSAVGLRGERAGATATNARAPRMDAAVWSGRLLERLERRWPNPVTTLDLRRSSRTGSAGAMGLVGLAGGVAAVAYALGLGPEVSGLPVPVCDGTLKGLQDTMQAVVALVPLVAGLACSYAVARTANEYWTSDDQRKALGAVMLTPLSSRWIAEGKFAAAALPAVAGLLLTMPIALVCAVLTWSVAGPLAFLLGYAWAACTVALAGYSALWGASTHPRGHGGTGRALSCLVTLHLCHWWYVSAVRSALDLVYSPSSSAWQQAGLYLPVLAIGLGLALVARRGAFLGVERRKLVDPYGPVGARE